MRLDLCTWREVETYLTHSTGIMLATGSTEQHGPMGLIGTDTICAGTIAERAAEQVRALLAPPIGLTPAPFNMAFPGTISVSEDVFETLMSQIVQGFLTQGFTRIYILNGHGANLAPLRRMAQGRDVIRIESWWDFEAVNALRREFYGDWEGMHATPSEVAITQALHRVVAPGEATEPPRKLSARYIADHAGDKHGPPDVHRRDFPDGRVGSHSVLATPEHGALLLEAATTAVAESYLSFIG